jgi:hypothetical protein
MNITQDLSIIELVINASLVVKLVMLLLTIVSLTSWYWIFRKAFAIRDARSKTDKFERDFWSGGDLNALYQSAVNNRHQTGALERIFEAGYREFTKLRGQKIIDPTAVIDGARRAMRATYQREIDDLEAHLAFLASLGLALRRPVRHGVGHHACLPRTGQHEHGDAVSRRTRYCGSTGGHRHRPLRGDSGGDRLQPLRP